MQGHWDAAAEQSHAEEWQAEIERAVEVYLKTPPQPPESIFDHLHAVLPTALAAQRDAMLQEAARRG